MANSATATTEPEQTTYSIPIHDLVSVSNHSTSGPRPIPGRMAGSLDDILSHIPTDRHLVLVESFLDRWIERKDDLNCIDPDIHRVFNRDQLQRAYFIDDIFVSFMKTLDLDSLDGVGRTDAEWLARRTARQIPIAARGLSIGGESIDTYTLCSHMNWSSKYLAKLEENYEILYFQAFEWKWYPVWQFDFQNSRIYPVVPEIISRFDILNEARNEYIMYWATRANPKLGNLTPAAWIEQGKSKSFLFATLDSVNIDQKIAVNNMRAIDCGIPSNLRTRKNLKISHNAQNIITKLKKKVYQLQSKDHIICHIPAFIEAVAEEIQPPIELSNRQLKQIGYSMVDEFIAGYIGFAYFYHELIHLEMDIMNLDGTICNWLGEIAAKKVDGLSSLIRMLGPRFTVDEVLDILDCDRETLVELENDNRLISFSNSDYCWYPTWQFDLKENIVRPAVIELLQLLKPPNGIFDNLTVASWFASRNTDGLTEHVTPAEWLSNPDHDPAELIPVARTYLNEMKV